MQSQDKRQKESSIENKLCQRYQEDLQVINKALTKKGGTKTLEKVWLRIGRIQERNRRVSGRYQLTLDHKDGKATKLVWKKQTPKTEQDKQNGVYSIRTNYTNPKEEQLWNIYNTIREVESTFRCLKSDLQIRPVYHQNDQRIENHIYLTILAYQLVNTIRHLLKQKGIQHDWKNILRIMNTQQIQDVVLPTPTKNVHLRIPSKPINDAKAIYDATNCSHTQKTIKKYVVYY